MSRIDCEFNVLFGAAISHVSHNLQVGIENHLSTHGGVDLLHDLKRFLGSCHRVVMSLCAKLFSGFMIASVMCGSGSGVRMGSVNMQVRCIVIFALGHCLLHIPGIIPPAVSASLPRGI
jgi:hypothetical protein